MGIGFGTSARRLHQIVMLGDAAVPQPLHCELDAVVQMAPVIVLRKLVSQALGALSPADGSSVAAAAADGVTTAATAEAPAVVTHFDALVAGLPMRVSSATGTGVPAGLHALVQRDEAITASDVPVVCGWGVYESKEAQQVTIVVLGARYVGKSRLPSRWDREKPCPEVRPVNFAS